MDMGRVLVFQQFFLERARTGARNAIVNNWTSTMTANFVCYNSTTAPTGGSGSVPGILGLLPSQVTVSTGTQSGTSVIQVSIQGISLFTWVPGMSGTYKTAPITVTLPAQSLGAAS